MGKLRIITFFSLILIVFSFGLSGESLEILAKDCVIVEPIYNTTFNLTGLKSELGHNIDSLTNEVLHFNVCGKLPQKCNNSDNISACYTKQNGSNIAFKDEKLYFTDGRLHFNYTGDRCTDKQNYTLHIILQCEYTEIKRSIIIMPHKVDECSFFVIWATPAACLPQPKGLLENRCTIKDDRQNVFDLTQLSHQNYKVPARDGTDYIINLCKPVIYGHNVMCPPGSSICHYNPNATDIKDKYHNYGTTSSGPMLEDGKIIMKYESEEKCNATHKRSSRIVFGCDPSNKYEEPEFLGEVDCKSSFLWQTPYACKNTEPCIYESMHVKFDLNELSGKMYNATDDKNSSYLFSVCKKPKDFPCAKDSGSCSSENVGLGKLNGELLFNVTGSPYLIYDLGSPCGKDDQTWSTKIEFICADEIKPPKVIENQNCMIIINFETKLACQDVLSCTATNMTDDTEINLTPLISSTHNYIANVSKELMAKEGYPTQYYINVCRPLVPQFGLSCPGGTSVCRAKVDNKKPENEQSLGYPDIELTIADDDEGISRAQLKYLRGSTCPTDNAVKMTSLISFYCKQDVGLGVPILKSIHECDYHFEWPTNIICPSHLCEFKQDTCSIYTDQLNKTIGLKDIIKDGKINVDYVENFEVNVCDKTNKRVLTDYQQSSVKIYFNATGPCGDNKQIHVELRLGCRNDEHISSLSDIPTCTLILTHETPLICPFLGITEPLNKKNDTDGIKPQPHGDNANEGMSVMGIVAITLTLTTLAGLVFVTLHNPERREQIMKLFGRRNVAVQYTRVNNDEASLLLQPEAGRVTDSDDELLI